MLTTVRARRAARAAGMSELELREIEQLRHANRDAVGLPSLFAVRSAHGSAAAAMPQRQLVSIVEAQAAGFVDVGRGGEVNEYSTSPSPPSSSPLIEEGHLLLVEVHDLEMEVGDRGALVRAAGEILRGEGSKWSFSFR